MRGTPGDLADMLPIEVTRASERRCHKCGVRRPVTMFYVALEERERARRGLPNLRMPCRLCQQVKNSTARADRRAYIDQIKLDAGCLDCGIASPHPEIYDFDHRDPSTKVATIAELFNSGTFEELVDEISKCDIVCANCHRIRTRQRVAGSFGRDAGPRSGRGT